MLYFFTVFIIAFSIINASFAFEIIPTQVTHVDFQHDLWKPSNAVVIRDGVACARVFQKTCSVCLDEARAICTFDAGNTFLIQQTQHPFCGNKGVVVNETLFCPLNTQLVNESVINVTVVSYSGSDSLVESVTNDIMMSFNYWPGEEILDIEFKGNTIYFLEDNEYLMSVFVKQKNLSYEHVMFASQDGFSWDARAKIPLNFSDISALTRRGLSVITVSSFAPDGHEIISSFDRYTWKRPIRYLNTSLPPAAVLFGSRIVVETGLSNRSLGPQLDAFVEGNASKKKTVSLIDIYKENRNATHISQDIVSKCDDEKDCLTSSFVALMSLQEGHLTALFDFVFEETKRRTIAAITMKVDDSEEKQELIDMLKKAEEAAKEREELMRKIRREKKEREEKERLEKQRKEKERRRQLIEADLVNLEAARARMAEDGEMIVVREVSDETVAIEKKVFFW